MSNHYRTKEWRDFYLSRAPRMTYVWQHLTNVARHEAHNVPLMQRASSAPSTSTMHTVADLETTWLFERTRAQKMTDFMDALCRVTL